MLDGLSDRIWDNELWFPKSALKINFTWKDLENRPGLEGYYPDVWDLNWSILLGVALLGVRFLFDSLIVVPIASFFGITAKPKLPVRDNAVLEKEFISNKGKINYSRIGILTKQTDLTQRQIEVWFRRRKQRDTPSQIQKVKECCWHLLFYGTAFIYGTVILWEKPWLWNTVYCWEGFPHFVDKEVYWYYMIELAFYWSLVFTIFSDHKRKDFTEMIVHHVATIFLLYFSWTCNFIRIGTLVLLVHDASDPWLALAKLCKYFKREKATDACFVVFFLTWIVSRLFFYPFYVLYSTTIEPYHVLITHTFFTHWFFNILLYTLMVLHILWSYSIFKIVINKIVSGQVAHTCKIRNNTCKAILKIIFIHWFFNILLYTLMVLHILWSYSIFKIVINKIVSGQTEDVRSDDDEEEVSDMELNGNHKVNGIVNGTTTTSKQHRSD